MDGNIRLFKEKKKRRGGFSAVRVRLQSGFSATWLQLCFLVWFLGDRAFIFNHFSTDWEQMFIVSSVAVLQSH